MHGFSDEFLEFLKTNHSTDYYKAISDDVKPETLTRIYGDYNNYFTIWEKVPSSIRLKYGGRVPAEIMELAATNDYEALRNIQEGKKAHPEEEERIPGYTPPEPVEIMASAAFAAALVAGYSQKASMELAEHRIFRDFLRDKAKAGTMTEAEKKEWRKSREQDKETIEKDWNNHQPEKLLVRLFARYNRGKISKEELLPRAADLMQKIESENRRDKLLEYIKSRPVQAKLARFHDDVLDTFSQTILQDIPRPDRREYLSRSIPLKKQMRQFIDDVNNGQNDNLQQKVNQLVQTAKQEGVGLDLSNYTADSSHPMPADLRQMFMVACCVNNIAYRSTNGERINLNSEYVRNLPADIQALVASRDMHLAKESMVKQTGSNLDKKTLVNNMSTVIRAKRGREGRVA